MWRGLADEFEDVGLGANTDQMSQNLLRQAMSQLIKYLEVA
jgi:hypothetical protein